MAGVHDRLRLRRAGVRDLETLVRHRRAMFRDMGGRTDRELDAADPVYRRWARQRIRSGKLVGFIVEDRRGVAAGSGCLWLKEEQPRPGADRCAIPYLLSMFTDPVFRGRGVASRIVRAATAWAKQAGFPRMVLHASPKGRPVYRRLGWERTWEMRFPGKPIGGRAGSRRHVSRFE